MVDNLENVVNGVYNIATTNVKIKDLASTVSEITGCAIEWIKREFEDQRNYQVSTKKAIEGGVLNLQKVRDVDHGIREIANLVKSGRIKYTENDIYFNERHIANLFENGKFF
ncbi:MAG: hypothetical protein PHE77_03105 [Candidatus Pacebacteria bacterium]|nr:hypothetical protein [Candidatus Paceibacterota bacterium]